MRSRRSRPNARAAITSEGEGSGHDVAAMAGDTGCVSRVWLLMSPQPQHRPRRGVQRVRSPEPPRATLRRNHGQRCWMDCCRRRSMAIVFGRDIVGSV